MKNPEVHDYLTRNDGLATRLRRARGAMTASELADRAGWNKSKVSKIESGKQLPSEEDLATWGSVTGADQRLVEQWRLMLVEAQSFRADFDQRMRNGQAPVQQEYSGLAESTTSFRFFETSVIPRYLQVAEYTRAVLEELFEQNNVPDDVDEATDERQRSSRYLYDSHRRFEFLLDEAVLRRRRFPPGIMRPQLDRLQSVIGLRNVRLGIYPSLSRPTKTLAQNSFELFDDIGYAETFISDGPRLLIDDVLKYDKILVRLWEDAVEGDEARRLINEIVADLSLT
jgi:transcriptional regulator with XRE-family HTH domain